MCTCNPQLQETTEAKGSILHETPTQKNKSVNQSTNKSITFHLSKTHVLVKLVKLWFMSVAGVIFFLSCLVPYFFEKSLSLNLEPTDWLDWLTSEPQGSTCFLAPKTRTIDVHHHGWLPWRGWESKFCFAQLDHCSRPTFILWEILFIQIIFSF